MVKAGILPLSVAVMTIVFAIIAMIAITNTTLVAIVTQPRILYGMAREDVVPAVFAKVHPTRRSPVVGLLFLPSWSSLLLVGGLLNRAGLGIDIVERLAPVTVVLLLAIYALVIVAAIKLRPGRGRPRQLPRPAVLLLIGIVGNLVLLVYVIVDDPCSLCGAPGCSRSGGVLFAAEYFFGKQDRPPAPAAGDQTLDEEGADMHVVVATDGSKQSLAAAKKLMSFADPAKITDISVVGVVSPYASVAFADEISKEKPHDRSFREAAEDAVDDGRPDARRLGSQGPPPAAQRLARHRDRQGGQGAGRRAGGRGQRQPRAERDGAAGQHRPAGPALGAVPGPGRAPHAQEVGRAPRRGRAGWGHDLLHLAHLGRLS